MWQGLLLLVLRKWRFVEVKSMLTRRKSSEIVSLPSKSLMRFPSSTV